MNIILWFDDYFSPQKNRMKKLTATWLSLVIGAMFPVAKAQAPAKAGYKLIFEENFDSTAWNSSTWIRDGYHGGESTATIWVGDGHLNDNAPAHQNIYDLSSHPGKLNFQLLEQHAPTTMWPHAWSPIPPAPGADSHNLNSCKYDLNFDGVNECADNYQFISGQFRSIPNFSYGYFEIKCKIPKGHALWEAFWLYGQNGATDPGYNWYNEIDVFEQVDLVDNQGNWFQNVQGNVHYSSISCAGDTDILARGVPNKQFNLYSGTVPDYGTVYHTYAVEWDPNYMVWYVDGNMVHVTGCNPYTPKHLMNVYVSYVMRNYIKNQGGVAVWDGPDYTLNTYPSGFEIDYIAVYKKQQVSDFGSGPTAGGWNNTTHKRMVADVNGDGKDDIVGFGHSQVIVALAKSEQLIPSLPPNVPQPVKNSFYPSSPWITGFCAAQGWDLNNHPRFVEDVTGDGKADIVGFADSGVLLAVSNGSGFNSPFYALYNFGAGPTAGGWDYTKHRRFVRDMNNDGKADIIGFGASKVFISYGTSSGFLTAVEILVNDFTYTQGWRIDRHPIELADIDGDNDLDIVGFYNDGVWVSYNNSGTFTPKSKKLSIFGYYSSAGTWRITDHLRLLADVSGDGRADIVGFGNDNVTVCKGNIAGNGFDPPVVWTNDFGKNDGWSVADHTRLLTDLNDDGAADIVAYYNDGVYGALSNISISGSGVLYGTAFLNTFLWTNYYGNNAGSGNFTPANSAVRTMGDFNGDGTDDMITFSATGVMAQLTSNCFGPTNVPEVEDLTHLCIKSTQPMVPADEPAASDIRLYPNPSTGMFNLETAGFDDSVISNYIVTDMIGKVILSGNITSSLTQIDLGDCNNGVYIISVMQGDQVQRFKAVKDGK